MKNVQLLSFIEPDRAAALFPNTSLQASVPNPSESPNFKLVVFGAASARAVALIQLIPSNYQSGNLRPPGKGKKGPRELELVNAKGRD